MKCIYCNNDSDLSVSDIIPAALTGAKLRKRFVCRYHNGFTNDHYEKKMIANLDIYRNQIGLTERDGGPVRYRARIEVDGYVVEEKTVSDIASIVNPKNPFRTKDESGHTVLIGETEQLLRIKGATVDKIQTINMGKVEVSRVDDLRELLISNDVLHAIAKIGYEWHCNHHGIESYDQGKYKDIVEYILTPDSTSPFVELVVSQFAYLLLDSHARTGSNMAFEYDDKDGFTYVIFSLFGVLMYKVRVCYHGKAELSEANRNHAYYYHADGSSEEIEFATVGPNTIASEEPATGLSRLCVDIKNRFAKLGERDLSRAYIENNIEKIKQLLPGYKRGKVTFAQLLDFEAQDRVIPVYIIELLHAHQSEYDVNDTFRNNMVKILQTDDRYVFTKEMKTKVVCRYMDLDQKGEFAAMLDDAIAFFESVCH